MKSKLNYLILGAGPAGLTFATRIKEKGVTSFLVLEKESVAGGLCRSAMVDGSPLDIGGGHFLDVRRPAVNAYLFRFMARNEWNEYERDSRIMLNGHFIHHPIEANLWEMPIDDQIKYLKSIAAAGCNTGADMPSEFINWIYWKLGAKIAEDYMIPYNKKMFGENINQLGTYWLSKLPSVNFEDTLRSCLTKHAYAEQPGHAHFLYPKKFGYGEVWGRMADSIKENMQYNKTVTSINFDSNTVTTFDGERYTADNIICTIPWPEFKNIQGMPSELKTGILALKSSAIQIAYKPENLETQAHWIYYPDPRLSYHRILVRHNFCPNSRGYWTETNSERISTKETDPIFKYLNPYAYPLNTLNKPEIMDKLLAWAETKSVFGLGRWGEHRHYNSDAVMELALAKADQMVG